MRICWLTDIHLNFLDAAGQVAFAEVVRAARTDAVLISGDIAEAPTVLEALEMLAETTSAAVYYVLGNHDFYRGSIESVRRACSQSAVATYLHGHEPVDLGGGVGLVGVDGWGDGLLGRPRESDLVFTDWYLISEFGAVGAVRDVEARLKVAGEQGAESAARLHEALEAAARTFDHVVILTHVPPFAAAAGHNGSRMAEIWVPWLACRSTGDVIEATADRYPDVMFEVLCGHTHTARVTHPRPNLVTHTGAATYRAPEIQRVWET